MVLVGGNTIPKIKTASIPQEVYITIVLPLLPLHPARRSHLTHFCATKNLSASVRCLLCFCLMNYHTQLTSAAYNTITSSSLYHSSTTLYQKIEKMIVWTHFLLGSLLCTASCLAFAPLVLVPGGQPSRRHETANILIPLEPTATVSPPPPPTTTSTQLAMIGRLFRRDRRKRVQTIIEQEEEESTKLDQPPTQQKAPDPVWRVILYNTEWQPEIVARILARTIPTLDRRIAFELCTQARMAGQVTLVITRKREAEGFCVRLQRQGLPVTMEPHGVER